MFKIVVISSKSCCLINGILLGKTITYTNVNVFCYRSLGNQYTYIKTISDRKSYLFYYFVIGFI